MHMINIINPVEKILMEDFIKGSTLMGSRGRALFYNHTIDENADYDYITFINDDHCLMGDYSDKFKLDILTRFGWKRTLHLNGAITISKGNIDLSVQSLSHKEKILKAWELQEQGLSKKDA